MRLIFMGTPDFALPTLDALVAAGHEIAAVYTRAPRPAGRGQRARPTPVQVAAERHHKLIRTPATLREPEAQAEFADLGADVAVVVAYGLILPQPVLDAPPHGCLNIHASLLPRWRGAAPIHRAVLAGDTQTGVCIMAMEAGLDTGPVLLHEAVPIGPDDTTGDLHYRLAALGARLIVAALARSGLRPEPQPAEGVTYAAKIDKAEAQIDWTRPAVDVDRQIRGLSPFPGAFTHFGDERIKALRSRLVEGDGPPGTALDDRLTVACGSGAVRIDALQRAGRAPADAAEVLRGFMVPRGSTFT